MYPSIYLSIQFDSQYVTFPSIIADLADSIQAENLSKGRDRLMWVLLQFISGSIQKNPSSDFTEVSIYLSIYLCWSYCSSYQYRFNFFSAVSIIHLSTIHLVSIYHLSIYLSFYISIYMSIYLSRCCGCTR